jgi:hypothetical protein
MLLPALLAASAFAGSTESPKPGYVKASGSPEDAAVFVNGKFVGPASRFTVPEKYELQAGSVEVTIRDPRCQDYTTKVSVAPGKTTHIHYKLTFVEPIKPPYGALRLTGVDQESYSTASAGDGAVYINGKYYGYVDELKTITSGVLLNPGSYTLSIDSSTYGDIRRQFKIEANKTTLLPVAQ